MPPARRIVGGHFSTGVVWRPRRVGAAFREPVALVFQGPHGGVVHESVDQGGGDHRVAEDLAPGLAPAVAGDDNDPRS
jgi:hypothetical protein